LGLRELQQALVEQAEQHPNIANDVPNSFDRLQQGLIDGEAKKGVFSLSSEVFVERARTEWKLSDFNARLAVDLFCDWGLMHRLSNGHLVLQPQQLADVLACVFTKKEKKMSKLGDLKEGLLRHDRSVLNEIWGQSGGAKKVN
jgi:hypothetical protein